MPTVPEPQPPKAAADFLPALQVARFLAASMVLVHHLELELATPRLNLPTRDVIGVEWSIGVDVFFMVSGFIMYTLSRGRFGEPGYASEFLRRRFVRVAPLYWLFTTLIIALILVSRGAVNHADLSAGRVISSYLFVPWARAGGDIYPILGLGWTLNYEVEFYLAFAVALCLPARWGLAALVGAFAIAAGLNPFVPSGWVPLKFWSEPIILEFLAGIGFAALYAKGVRLGVWTRVGLLALGLGLSIATTRFHLVDAIPRPLWGGVPAACVFAGVCLGEQPGRTGPLLAFAVLGGDASYALYLTHMFSIRILTSVWAHFGLGTPLAYLGAGLVTATVAAIFVHLWIERPILRALTPRLSRRRPSPTS